MKAIVICEFSGIVRDALRARGVNAMSLDLLPCMNPGPHLQADARMKTLDFYRRFDLGICFPPCTDLAVSGARWFAEKRADGRQQKAIEFVLWLWNLPIPKLAIENPIGILSTVWRKPDQIIQPWQFGHGETKATCLWLRGLPLLQPTNIVSGRIGRVWREPPHPDRWKRRSITYQGIADAMAEQWGNL